MGGLFVSAVAVAAAIWFVLTGTVPAKWPFQPTKIDESPREFWVIVGFCIVIALGGIFFSFNH